MWFAKAFRSERVYKTMSIDPISLNLEPFLTEVKNSFSRMKTDLFALIVFLKQGIFF